MAKNKVLLFFLTILLTLNFACAKEPSQFKPGSEPNGFRDIKWDTSIMRLIGVMVYVKQVTHPRETMYYREKDDLQMEWVELESIKYFFWKERFYAGAITTKGNRNFNLFKNVLFDKFGEAKIEEHGKGWSKYRWLGEITDMELRYIEDMQVGSLRVESKEISKEVRKQTAKYVEKKEKQKRKERREELGERLIF